MAGEGLNRQPLAHQHPTRNAASAAEVAKAPQQNLRASLNPRHEPGFLSAKQMPRFLVAVILSPFQPRIQPNVPHPPSAAKVRQNSAVILSKACGFAL